MNEQIFIKRESRANGMASKDKLEHELNSVKKDLALIKHILEENYELSDEAKKALAIARKTPKSQFIDA